MTQRRSNKNSPRSFQNARGRAKSVPKRHKMASRRSQRPSRCPKRPPRGHPNGLDEANLADVLQAADICCASC
eukprot:8303988-Pyramimonas_sp.AAC.1